MWRSVHRPSSFLLSFSPSTGSRSSFSSLFGSPGFHFPSFSFSFFSSFLMIMFSCVFFFHGFLSFSHLSSEARNRTLHLRIMSPVRYHFSTSLGGFLSFASFLSYVRRDLNPQEFCLEDRRLYHSTTDAPFFFPSPSRSVSLSSSLQGHSMSQNQESRWCSSSPRSSSPFSSSSSCSWFASSRFSSFSFGFSFSSFEESSFRNP